MAGNKGITANFAHKKPYRMINVDAFAVSPQKADLFWEYVNPGQVGFNIYRESELSALPVMK
jgi:hypothetical protein